MKKQTGKSAGFCSTAFIILVMCAVTLTLNAQVKKRAAGNLITPGQGVGQVKIGDSLEQILRLYPKLKRNNYYESDGCLLGEMSLPDSVRLFFKNKQVIQILAEGNYSGIHSQTADKISAGSTSAQVKIRYPNANRTYTKLDSIAVSTGYAPLIYWVDAAAGIAFEFYTDQQRGRMVDKIHIFTPGGKIQFGGSCETEEDLRELPPFATKVPERLIKEYEDRP